MNNNKFLIIILLLLIGGFGQAQTPFDSTLIWNQKQKLGNFYFDLMQKASSREIKIITEKEFKIEGSTLPDKELSGEATFVYEIGDNDSLTNVYMTEFWFYTIHRGDITVKDYIIFVDNDNYGFDYEKIKLYKLNPISARLIKGLFDYVWGNRKFKILIPREKNLKYERVKF